MSTQNICNLKYRVPDHIPIVFHNLSGYDANLFIKQLGRKFNKDDIESQDQHQAGNSDQEN